MRADDQCHMADSKSCRTLASACLLIVTVPALADSPGEAGKNTGMENIVVTAQRREERMQDVPIAVAVVSGESALRQGFADTESLTAAVPGLVYTRQADGATPFLRGVGNSVAAAGQEATVATYIDGVYISSPQAALFEFNNIERIEVLKGPQGTLFGRNATGGVIQIVTRKPSFDPEFETSLGYANFQTASGSLYATTGLTDRIAMDIAAVGLDQSEGWGTALTSGKEMFTESSYALRSKVSFLLTEKTSFLLAGSYSDTQTDVGLNWHTFPNSHLRGGVGYAGIYNSFSDPVDDVKAKHTSLSGTFEQEYGWARLTSITSFQDMTSNYLQDADGTATVYTDAYLEGEMKTFSQELQLAAPSESAVQWLVGAYYFHDNTAFDPVRVVGLDTGGAVIQIFGRQKTDSYALFGQGTAEIFENTNLTLGARYTEDQRELIGHIDVNAQNVAGMINQDADSSKMTWRVALDHRFTDVVLGYVSYNRGFKSAVFNLVNIGSPVVDPEVLDAYEVGFKTEWFERLLRFNVAAFYYDYQDIQVDSQVRPGTFSILNAAAATLQGVDLELTAAPIRGLTISSGVSLLKAEYDEFPNAPFYMPNPPEQGGNFIASEGTCPPEAPFSGSGCDASGNRMVRAPRVTYNVAIDYRLERASGDYDVNLNFYRNGGFEWDFEGRLSQPAYNLLNASLGWEASDRRWNVRLWGKNLLNEEYNSGAVESGTGDIASPGPPRTYGVTFGIKLGGVK